MANELPAKILLSQSSKCTSDKNRELLFKKQTTESIQRAKTSGKFPNFKTNYQNMLKLKSPYSLSSLE
jgi:hypothetical protein